ncbi:MAG: AAA family ATPase [Pseudonocardiaceae bacterium]
MLAGIETELATEVDALLAASLTGLGYEIAVYTCFPGAVWITQISRRMGAVAGDVLDQLLALAWSDEPDGVVVPRGVPLQPAGIDPRYPALARMSAKLDQLTDHCHRPASTPRAPRPTRLVGLELKNFKSVRQADITIGALTVIVGANSTGKSSVLQAVLAMSQVTRWRIDGHRFSLNDEFAWLGTFEAVRHQRADPVEPVRIGMRFSTDARDVWRYSAVHFRAAGRLVAPPSNREPPPLDVCWAVELDSATEDQIGSAQISAIEVHTEGDRFPASVRLERARTPSLFSRQRYDLAEGLAFTGTVRSADSETAVLDALMVLEGFEAELSMRLGRLPVTPNPLRASGRHVSMVRSEPARDTWPRRCDMSARSGTRRTGRSRPPPTLISARWVSRGSTSRRCSRPIGN